MLGKQLMNIEHFHEQLLLQVEIAPLVQHVMRIEELHHWWLMCSTCSKGILHCSELCPADNSDCFTVQPLLLAETAIIVEIYASAPSRD